MENTNANAVTLIEVVTHPFEKAGFGRPPFRYVGHTESVVIDYPGASPRPGSSCDYCGAAIRDVFFVESADGKKFKVGCDCVKKTERRDNVADRKFTTAIEKIVKAKRNAAARERNARKGEAATTALIAILGNAAHRETLAAMPHPYGREGGYLASCEWLLDHAGTTGRVALLKSLIAKLGI